MSTQQRYPKVVVYSQEITGDGSVGETFEACFKKHYPSASITVLDPYAEPDIGELAEAEVLVTDPILTADLIPRAKKLKWLQFTFAGYVPFVKYVQRTGQSPSYRVTRQGGTYGPAMAEYVIAQIVAHDRKFALMREDQKAKQRRRRDPVFRGYQLLSGRTIGVVGAGDIGCEIARKCKALGMRTVGLVSRKRSPQEKSPFIDDYRVTEELAHLLAESDVICCVLPGKPSTKGFFDENAFKSCTKKQLFINIGEGSAVSSSTIVKAIENGWLSGAVLDVVDPAPLPPECPLWEMAEVTLTPASAGITPENILVQLFIRNYAKYVKGEKMEYELDVTNLHMANRL